MGTRDLNPRNTNFQSYIMGIMLPPIQRDGSTYVPGINEYFDGYRSGKMHGGIDFNYHFKNGGKVTQTGVNLSRPA